MAENTKIEWCDHTFNPWMGCSKVAEGCRNCYAETLMDTRWGKVQWGPNGTRVRTADANWRKPVSWNRAAEKAGEIKTVFCASLADVFEEWTGPVMQRGGILHRSTDGYTLMGEHDRDRAVTLTDLRADLFRLIDATPHLMWLLLTKRPENVLEMWPDDADDYDEEDAWADPSGEMAPRLSHRPNVALITSVSTQADADRNIPLLLQCRDLCPVLGVSAEPLVEAVDLFRAWGDYIRSNRGNAGHTISWVIAGGESGPGARPCRIEWLRSIVGQCRTSGVPCFVKQLGSVPYEDDSGITGAPINVSNLTRLPGAAMKDPKGGDPSEWPADLRVREFPETVKV